MTFSYLPDAPPETPNAWTVCDGFHADTTGAYRTGFIAATYDDDIPAECQVGMCYRETTTNDLGIIAFKPLTTLGGGPVYVWDPSGGWNDRSGAALIGATTNRALAQYGNITLLANGSGGIYSRDATGTSDIAAVGGSPTCTVLLVTPLNIVMALHCIEPTPVGSSQGGSDAWAASAAGDYTAWASGVAESGNLRQTPGPLTAGVLLGNDVIAFKRKGVYRGSFVNGANFKWKWNLVHPSLGAWGPQCAVSTPAGVFFWGDDGFYLYDGSSFTKRDIGVSVTITNTIGDPATASIRNYAGLSMHYDPQNRRVVMFNFGTLSAVGVRGVKKPQHFTYNIDSGKWGYQSLVNDTATNYLGVLENAHELNTFSSGVWAYNSGIALFDEAPAIKILTTEFSSSNVGTYKPKLRTHRLGTRSKMTTVSGFIPHWTKSDGAGTDLSGATLKTAQPYGSDSPMEAETAIGSAVTLSTDLYRADYTASRRYQSVELQIGAEAVLTGGEWRDVQTAGSN